MFVSISVTSYNRKELTKYCIDSILKHTPRKSFELIVIDNQSKDGAIKMLSKMRNEGKIDKFFINKKDTNLGTAINLAWDRADIKAGWLITFSNDHFVMDGWLENLLITVKDLGLDYALTHLLMPKFKPGGRKVLTTYNGGKYLEKRDKDKFIFGGGLAIKRQVLEKNKIRFPETDVNSPFSVMCKQLYKMKLKGVEMAKPTSLQQDSEWNNPKYEKYYKKVFGKRIAYRKNGTVDRGYGLKTFKRHKIKGYTPYIKEYYEGTDYLEDVNADEKDNKN